jgi:hypothetical protein
LAGLQGLQIEVSEEIFLLCDRRRRVAAAFWISLVWVAFLIWGLLRLQVEVAKVAKDRE